MFKKKQKNKIIKSRKRSNKIISSIISCIFMFGLISPAIVNATTIRVDNKHNEATMRYLKFSNGNAIFFPTKVIAGTNKEVYCLQHEKLTPQGELYVSDDGAGEIDGGVRYILSKNPNTGNGDKDYYIKQLALQYYLGQVPEVRKAVDSPVKRAILQIANEAKEHSNDPLVPNLVLSPSNPSFEYYPQKDTYETDWINIKTVGDINDLYTKLEAPSGMQIVLPGGKVVNSLGKNDKKFFLRIDRDKVKNDFSIKMGVRANFNVTEVTSFIPRNTKYQKIAYPQETVVKGNKDSYLTAKLNKVYGKLEVIKKGDNGKLLDGAKFSLYKENGKTKVAEGVTKDGKIVFSNLDQGTYILREDEAPKGYVVNVKDTTVKVVVEKTNTVDVINKEIKGRIQIVKVDEETGAKLEGAKFELKDKTTGKVLETVTTDKQGVAVSNYYNYGTQIAVKEVKAPAKYTLNGKEYLATITENMKTIEIKVPDRIIKGTISIHKIDKETKKPLEGVEFNILNSDNKVVETIKTDKDGNAKTKELNYGDYTILEVKGVEGYLINNTPIKVSITENKDYSFTVDNQIIKGRVQILKVDEETGAKLEGAKFELKDKTTGKVLETVITDKQGVAVSNYYNYGTQIAVKEVKAPAKYTLNGKEYLATITENMKTIEIKVPDRIIKGTISIHKIDKETKKPLEGVEFNILNSDNKVVETIKTDKDGNAKTKELNYGDYTILEVKGVEGYLINNTPIKVSITENKDYSFTVDNQIIKGRVQILKVDEETGAKLEGAKFELKDKTTGKVLETVTTDKQGVAVSNYYNYGTQIAVKEVKAPAKYTLNGKEYLATITENMKTIEIKVPDRIIKGTISIHKIDKETKKPLEGVEFNILNSDNKVVETIKTDKDGNAKTKELNYGDYTILEVKGVEGYLINNTPIKVSITENKDYSFTVDNQIIKGRVQILKVDEETGAKLEGAKFELKDKTTGKVLETVTTDKQGVAVSNYYNYGTQIAVKEVKAPAKYTLNGKEYLATITENMKTIEIKVPDRIIKGTISIHKIDKETKKPLEGVEFNILNSDNKVVETIKTDKDGNAKTKELNYGDYTILEVKGVEGYLINNTPIKVSITENKDYSFTVDNQIIKGRVQILKVDEETGAKLEGAKFELKDKTTGKVLETVITDKQGVAVSNYYNYGTQIAVKEVKAPAKYTLNGKEYFATITENMKTIEIKVPDRIIKGTISIHKIDKETKKPLEGVEFNILNSDNKVVETIKTDKDGNAKTKELNYGQYKIVEVKTNKYYNLNKEVIEVSIIENKDYNFTVENTPITGKLLIKKVDIATGKDIEGAKIKITCIEGLDKGKVIEFVSGKTAKEFDLKAGKYTYEEVAAPKGYELNKEVGQFEITKEGQVVKSSVKDKAIKKPAPKLPRTGYTATIVMIGIGLIMIIAGLIVVLKKNNSNNSKRSI